MNLDGFVDEDDDGPLIGIGLPHPQHYSFDITITGAAGGLNSFAFLDVVAPGFELDGLGESDALGCVGDECDGISGDAACPVTISGPPARKGEIDERYILIEPDAGASTCTTTVFLATTISSGGKGKKAAKFEPVNCEMAATEAGGSITNTVTLTPGVKVFNKATGDLVDGPVGSIQLGPFGCL